MILTLPCLLVHLGLLANASAETVVVDFAEAPKGYGLGVVVGDPTGLSGIWRMGDGLSVDGALAWSIPDDRIHLHADCLYDLVTYRDSDLPNVEMPLYLGAGARIRLGWDQKRSSSSVLGLRIPLGVAFLPEDVPIDGFVEIAPVVGLFPETSFDLDAGLGLRVFFGRKDPPGPYDPIR